MSVLKSILYWFCKITPLVSTYVPKAKELIDAVEEVKKLKKNNSLSKSWRDVK